MQCMPGPHSTLMTEWRGVPASISKRFFESLESASVETTSRGYNMYNN